MGKDTGGIFSDFMRPAEPTMVPIAWLVTFEKKNQKIRPDVA